MTAPGSTPGSPLRDLDTDRLIDFLRDRDARCPLCGYNLRDLTGPTCPECAQHLKLTVGVHNMRFGWFLATVAPGIFSGIAAVLLLVPLCIAIVFGGGGPMHWAPVAVDLFGLASGSATVVLIVKRRRFLILDRAAQKTWAIAAWTLHVAALLTLICLTVLLS